MAVKKLEVVCLVCSAAFQRVASEVNRNTRLSRPNYCSRSCAGKGNLPNLPAERIGNPAFLSRDGRTTDEFSPFRTALRITKKRAIEKERDFDLTLQYLQEVWQSQKGSCPYTGWKMYLPKSSGDYNRHCNEENPRKASIDRIDSAQGYIIGNVQFVSHIANLAKHNYSHDTMLEFCQAVAVRWRME